MRFLLAPFALLYGLFMFIRRLLFRLKILKSKQFDIPIICVGNLSMGGTGKTPHIEYLVRLLQAEGLHIATLSRGYKRKTKGFLEVLPTMSAEESGDEPLQFKQKYPDIYVNVCENRANGVKQILTLHPDTDVVLLDDAFQHLGIKAGLNILLTDYYNLYTKDHVVPWGNLREFAFTARYADLIVVSKTPKIFSPLLANIINENLHPQPHQQIYFSFIDQGKLRPLTEAAEAMASPSLEHVLLVTGIGNPIPIREKLISSCYQFEQLNYPDHHYYTSKNIKEMRYRFGNMVGSKKIIVTTEKDATRFMLPDIRSQITDLPIFVLPMEITFIPKYKEPFDQQIISYVRNHKQNSSRTA